MEALDIVAAPATNFVKSCVKVLKRCTLPSTKILKDSASASAVGFLILGSVGFIFKVIAYPINNVIIGGIGQ